LNWGAASILLGLFALAATAPLVGVPLLAAALLLFGPFRRK
jgi:hypothetical protein